MKRMISVAICLLACHSILLAQDGYFHPEREGDKWGVQRSYNKMDRHANTDYVSEWTHKPRFDLVLYDTLRCHYTGNGCEGFFSYKKGKLGYLWKNGNKLENEFDALDISHHIGRKNGKWGGFDEENNILPFEYDSLIAITYFRPEQSGDTLSVRFAALKNGKWKLIVVRTWSKWEQSQVSDLVSTEFDGYISGNVVKKEGQWYFIKAPVNAAPVYSPPYDAIKYVGYWAVQKNGKWAPLEWDQTTPKAPYEWDDMERCLTSGRYIVVKKDGLYGLIRSKSGFEVVVPPKATSVTVASDKEDARITALIDGATTTYDWTGKMLSNSGDMSVSGVSVRGPFRVTYHDDGKVTVCDNASGKVLLQKDFWVVDYAKSDEEGDYLKLKKLGYNGAKYGKYGRYQYSSATLIEPVYDVEFDDFGAGHFKNSKGDGLFSEILFWSKKDYHRLSFPFTPTLATNKQGLLIRDNAKNWYAFSEHPVKVDASTITYRQNTWGSQLTYEEMEDGSFVITSMNGSTAKQRVESIKELYGGTLLEMKAGGKATVYAYDAHTLVPCKYTIGAGAYIKDCIWDLNDNPHLLLVDSASQTVLVNPLNNMRLILPYSSVRAPDSSGSKDVFGKYKSATFIKVNGLLYSFCNVSLSRPQLCRSGKCSCSGGKIVTGTKTVGTADKYVAPKTTTSTSSNYENTWNPNTNSYVGVRTKTTTTHTDPGYTIKGTQHEEKIYETCPRCHGTGRASSTLIWNGTEFR